MKVAIIGGGQISGESILDTVPLLLGSNYEENNSLRSSAQEVIRECESKYHINYKDARLFLVE